MQYWPGYLAPKDRKRNVIFLTSYKKRNGSIDYTAHKPLLQKNTQTALSIVDSFTTPSQAVLLLLPTIERSTVFSKSCRTYATNIWPTGRSFKNRLNSHIFWTPTPTYIAAESGKDQYNKGRISRFTSNRDCSLWTDDWSGVLMVWWLGLDIGDWAWPILVSGDVIVTS